VGVRADWHLNTPPPSQDFDPFEAASLSSMATSEFAPGGPPISLDSPEPQLRDRLHALLDYEGRLDARGITCPLKDLPDASCLACPVSKADDLNHRKCPLCRVGITQELVANALIAKRVADQGVLV